MAYSTLAIGGIVAATLCGCAGGRLENAAVRMPWPRSPSPDLVAYAPPAADYPSVGGDVLKGASPADREAARAAAIAPPVPPRS
ncbi:MAG: hypothetical protein ABI376_07640 [Caulobacteraceae bacterium]